MKHNLPMLLVVCMPILFSHGSRAATAGAAQPFAPYFRAQTAEITAHCLADVRTLADWRARRAQYRRELEQMLGLWPMPKRTPLKPVITGKIEAAEFTVEKLDFQALPHLYVTANLYLPKHLEQPAPAILYVCGHAPMKADGVSFGNKTAYQHHGEWFARNGYVCLVIDSLQLGEIQGMHHGTYSKGQWWWNSRGYTPAGVEAWFGIRALDYLCSRPEVDKNRIGMTGRSGGGSYTWTVTALDDRVKVAAPVAGMTDLQNQVVDGAIEGHCDCMFFLNSYRWDFTAVAALIAPRPLLIANSDKDTLFPLDGVVRLYMKTRRIYQLYGRTNRLGLLITDGPHADTQDLQLPVFRWFNRYLKGEDPIIAMAATPFFKPAQLRVFDKLPSDQINTKIQYLFVPEARPAAIEQSGWPSAQERTVLLHRLREKVFRGWPEAPASVQPLLEGRSERGGLVYRRYELNIQPGITLPLWLVTGARNRTPRKIALTVLDAQSWTPAEDPNDPWAGPPGITPEEKSRMRAQGMALAFFAPRGINPAAWTTDKFKATQVRRRFMLLGQTLDGMRVWDIRCAARALASLPEFRKSSLVVRGEGTMGINAAYAALFEPEIGRLELAKLPKSHTDGPDYLNVLRVWDIPQMLQMLGDRAQRRSWQ
jgi:X-Pro dipeptidyl-peptidase (S15 family)